MRHKAGHITFEDAAAEATHIFRWRFAFVQNAIDACSKPKEFKALLFSLCYFHALIIGRKKFGFIGWSRAYSFNDGDLAICGNVIRNYLDRFAPLAVSALCWQVKKGL